MSNLAPPNPGLTLLFEVDTLPQAWWFWVVAAYLFGSIPFAWLIARARGVNIRKVGSGNVGATNVWRGVGKPWGVLCFVLDTAKGTVPVLLAGHMMSWLDQSDLPAHAMWQWLAVAAAAMIGHVFPLWLKFKGGKGVATGLGAVLGVYPHLTLPGVVCLAAWIIVLRIWRYVGLASVVAAIVLPLAVLLIGSWRSAPWSTLAPLLIVTASLALLVVYRHKANLLRIYMGVEPKVKGH